MEKCKSRLREINNSVNGRRIYQGHRSEDSSCQGCQLSPNLPLDSPQPIEIPACFLSKIDMEIHKTKTVWGEISKAVCWDKFWRTTWQGHTAYDSAIVLLGDVCTHDHRKARIRRFLGGLSIVAPNWKQPQRPQQDNGLSLQGSGATVG